MGNVQVLCLAGRTGVHGYDWSWSNPYPEVPFRRFGALSTQYHCAVGEEAYSLPEKYTLLKSRAAAYLFTDMELTSLFRAIDQLPPTKKEPFLNEIAPALYRLIHTCGLRLDEGRELPAENVNLETGESLITHTKRNKERIVVMSDDMLTFARKYEQRRRILG